MFSRHNRKVRVLFALSDILLTAIAFEAAYQTRLRLSMLEHNFFIDIPRKALLLGYSIVVWVALGYWFSVYDKLDSAHPRVILRDTFRQSAYSGLCLVVFEYILRLDLSRPFLLLFFFYTWVLLLLFPLPYIANTAGWMTAELGRQPWLVYGLLRTVDGYSKLVSAGNAWFSFLGFLGMYTVLSILFLFLVRREIEEGPEPWYESTGPHTSRSTNVAL